MNISYYNSPIGILKIVCNYDILISLKLTDNSTKSDCGSEFTKNIKIQLSEYFSGKRKTFDIKTEPEGTAFQKKVWEELLKIPYGETRSYSEIAKNIGEINSQRAVGNACNKNPVIIIIPCHRVIAKNGNLTGFAYGINIKEKLINLEKIRIFAPHE